MTAAQHDPIFTRLTEALIEALRTRDLDGYFSALDDLLKQFPRVEEGSAWPSIETCPHSKIVILFAITDRNPETGEVRNWKMETGFLSSTGEWHWPNRLSAWDIPPTNWRLCPEPPL